MSALIFDREVMGRGPVYLEWICPRCGDVCKDPPGVTETVCHNDHAVRLGVGRGGKRAAVLMYEEPQMGAK